MTADARVRWHAWEDGVAHAVRGRGRAIRTVCGLPVLEERYDRPPATWCPQCSAAVPGEVPTARLHR